MNRDDEVTRSVVAADVGSRQSDHVETGTERRPLGNAARQSHVLTVVVGDDGIKPGHGDRRLQRSREQLLVGWTAVGKHWSLNI